MCEGGIGGKESGHGTGRGDVNEGVGCGRGELVDPEDLDAIGGEGQDEGCAEMARGAGNEDGFFGHDVLGVEYSGV